MPPPPGDRPAPFRRPVHSPEGSATRRDADLAERVEAFASRYGRLQDTLGDKLLRLTLLALGERPAAGIDNLDRAERLGLLNAADEWMAMRKIRKQMVHEYIEDMTVLASALRTAHDFVPVLIAAANAMVSEAEQRGWL